MPTWLLALASRLWRLCNTNPSRLGSVRLIVGLVPQAVRAEEIYKLLQNRFSTWEEEQARRGAAAAAYRGW